MQGEAAERGLLPFPSELEGKSTKNRSVQNSIYYMRCALDSKERDCHGRSYMYQQSAQLCL